MADTKIRSIVIDTLTGIQNEEYMSKSGKPGFDQWTDFGKDIWKLITFLQESGFEIILVLGEPGKFVPGINCVNCWKAKVRCYANQQPRLAGMLVRFRD